MGIQGKRTMELQGEIGKSAIIVGDFNTPPSSSQQRRKGPQELTGLRDIRDMEHLLSDGWWPAKTSSLYYVGRMPGGSGKGFWVMLATLQGLRVATVRCCRWLRLEDDGWMNEGTEGQIKWKDLHLEGKDAFSCRVHENSILGMRVQLLEKLKQETQF